MSAGHQRGIAPEAANQLQAERHAVVIGAAGQRQSRIGGQGDGVAERQPAVIIVQLHAVDLTQVQLAPRERRHRRGRRKDQVVTLELLLKAAEQTTLLGMRFYAILQRHGRAHVEIGAGVGAECVGILVVGVLQTRNEGLGAKDVECAMRSAEVQVDGLAGFEQRFQDADLFPEHCADLLVHRAGAEVFAVADAQLAQVDGARRKLVVCHCIAQWVGVRQTGAGTQLQQRIGDVASHGTDHRQRRPAKFFALARHQSG